MNLRRLNPRAEVLGMNHRNRHLVSALNPKPLIALANDKSAAKERLAGHGVPVPDTLREIRSHRDVQPAYEALVEWREGFVVKPARSSRGRGVTICSRAFPDHVLDHENTPVSRRQFCFGLLQILDGEFSFGRSLDAVIVEQRLEPDRSWILQNAPGAPDLRIIVARGRPVMAMARVPTCESEGRANLHRGAVGLGIDLESGLTTTGIWKNRPVTHHPDTGQPLEGHAVRGMPECLQAAMRCYQAVPLGYMGVDILFDARLGPRVIEINARPGLSVQIANRQGLIPRCQPSAYASTNQESSGPVMGDLAPQFGALRRDWVPAIQSVADRQ